MIMGRQRPLHQRNGGHRAMREVPRADLPPTLDQLGEEIPS